MVRPELCILTDSSFGCGTARPLFKCCFYPTGSFAKDAADREGLNAYFEKIKAKLTEDLSQVLSNPDQAQ